MTHLPFSRVLSCFCSAIALLLAAGICSAAQRAPNIVLIMADDLGFSDLGCYGSEIHTPNIDKLASEGIRFRQFYNTAHCETTRSTLLTGLYNFEVQTQSLNDCVTIAEALRPANYSTMMVGKWHLKSEPTDRGFEHYFGHLSGATNYFWGDDTFRLDGKSFGVPKTGFYTTDANADYAIKFLDQSAKEKPFFLYVAFNAPHYPLMAPKEDVDKYRGRYKNGWDPLRAERYARQLESGLIDKKWALSPRPAEAKVWNTLTAAQKDQEDLKMATFAGMVDHLDRSVGRIIGKLDQMGVTENTLMMFLSDNGACPFDRAKNMEFMPWDARSFWTYHTAWANASNTPFRLYKQNHHEGGDHTPFIAHWPAVITQKGQMVDQIGHLVDVMATCVDISGAKYPTSFGGHPVKPLRGTSLLPVFNGGAFQPHEALFYSYSGNRAVRMGPWKLVAEQGTPWELYDMDADRTELHNLAKDQPERVAAMSARWDAWAKEVGVSDKSKKDVKADAGKGKKARKSEKAKKPDSE